MRIPNHQREVLRVEQSNLRNSTIGNYRDWLLQQGADDERQAKLLGGLARHLNDLGIPVDRLTTAIDALHSEYAGVGRIWTREEGSSFRLFPHGAEAQEIYQRSPFAFVPQILQAE